MRKNSIRYSIFLFLFSISCTNKLNTNSTKSLKFEEVNRSVDIIKENDKTIIRLSEAKGSGVAWVKGVLFSEGVIEFDARGRDVLQKSFLGIAFHASDNETYETVYFRPFNFQTNIPERKIHAVQYSYEPFYNFKKLRETRKDEFEAPIYPTTIQATDWFHVKVEVKNNRIKAYLNRSDTPCLNVEPLNNPIVNGKIGFWVGNESNGDFANLMIVK